MNTPVTLAARNAANTSAAPLRSQERCWHTMTQRRFGTGGVGLEIESTNEGCWGLGIGYWVLGIGVGGWRGDELMSPS